MLTPHHGGFLGYPFGLELSFNYCSHGCSYCFANHAAPHRETGIGQLQRLLADYQNRETLTAQLMQGQYLTLVSNRVDAFAQSNYQQAVPILRTMTELGLPYCMASRGGPGVDDVLSFAPRMVWYLSVCQDNDDLRKRIEPGAPSLSSRLALAEKLVKRGDIVHLAVNPYVPEWWDDFPRSLRPYRDLGITRVYVQLLHLNINQKLKMSPKERAAIDSGVMSRAMKNPRNVDHAPAFAACVQLANMGFRPHNFSDDYPDNAYAEYAEVYPRQALFPMATSFIDWCFARGEDQFIVSFEEYRQCLSPALPKGVMTGIRDYVSVSNREFCVKNKVPQTGTYDTLLRIAWNFPLMQGSPLGFRFFAYLGEKNGKEEIIDEDENGNVLLVFRRSGFADGENLCMM